jgi:hypothetical protein
MAAAQAIMAAQALQAHAPKMQADAKAAAQAQGNSCQFLMNSHHALTVLNWDQELADGHVYPHCAKSII